MSDDCNGQAESANQPEFEAALGQLEDIVHDLEEGDLGLSDSLGRYEKGVGLLKQCYRLLEQAERRVQLLTGVDGEGNPVAEAYDDSKSTGEEGAPARSKRRSATPKTGAKRAETRPISAPDVDEPPGLF